MPDEESMIQDLREIEQEFRDNNEYRKANVIDLFITYSTHCKIPREKIIEMIKQLNIDIKRNEKRRKQVTETDSEELNLSLIMYEPETVKQRLLKLLED